MKKHLGQAEGWSAMLGVQGLKTALWNEDKHSYES